MTFIKRAVATFLAAISLFFSVVSNPGWGGKKENFRVTSYVVASRIQNENSLHSEDFDIITDVILFGCASFNAKGEVETQKAILETALSNLKTVIKNRNVKIHINLLGPGALENHNDFYENMADQGKQHTLAFKSGMLEDNIAALLEEYNFDGVFFDYEYPLNYKNWTPFNQFLVRLDGKIGNRVLGLAVSEWDIKLSLGSFMAVDRFEVMLYDVYDSEGRHATPQKVKELSENLKKYSIPKEKLDFGLPFYSKPTDRDAYWYAYADYCDRIDENGYYHDSYAGKTFWFNRPDDIAETTRFALDNDFGGVMIWHYSCDFSSDDSRSLLGAVGKTVAGY